MKNKLILVRGNPGSGKSSFVKETFPSIFHIENDMFHYHDGEYKFNARKQELAIQWCIDSCLLAMNRGMDVVVSNTFTKKKYIQSYVKLAEIFNYDVEIYRMMGNFKNIHGVDENMVQNFKNSMEDWDGEKFAYPLITNCDKKEYLITELKVGDNVIDKNGKIGKILGISVSEENPGHVFAAYETEEDLFNESSLGTDDINNLKKIV